MTSPKFVLTLVLPVLLCCMTGCGSQGPEIRGVVTLDGKPVQDARVQFTPATDETLRSLFATTDAEGKFEIPPDPDTGATLEPDNQYKVTITKKALREGAKVPPELEGDMEQLEAMGLVRETIPPKFSRESETTLTADIKAEPNELKYDLTSK